MKISIITVCLNSEQTIEQTIQSVISQKHKKIEYIIIDGNSTDRTLEIINKYKNRIDIILSEPDHGLYDAMNKGISLATGEIIGIINSDDWYEQGIFDKIQKCFCDSNADVVYGKMNVISENGNIKLSIPTNIKKLRYKMAIPHPTVFVKKAIYERYGGFSLEYKIAADYDLMLRYYLKGVKFIYLNELLANFRSGGISNKQSKICACETLSIAKKYLPYSVLNERVELESLINNKWKSFLFKQLLYESQNYLLDSIKKRLHKELKNEISIFGAGKWGRNMFELLSNSSLFPSHIVDNNKNLWGKSIENIKVSSPDILTSFDGIILILVKGFSQDILLQIKEMGNSMMICITWEDLVNELKDYVFSG